MMKTLLLTNKRPLKLFFDPPKIRLPSNKNPYDVKSKSVHMSRAAASWETTEKNKLLTFRTMALKCVGVSKNTFLFKRPALYDSKPIPQDMVNVLKTMFKIVTAKIVSKASSSSTTTTTTTKQVYSLTLDQCYQHISLLRSDTVYYTPPPTPERRVNDPEFKLSIGTDNQYMFINSRTGEVKKLKSQFDFNDRPKITIPSKPGILTQCTVSHGSEVLSKSTLYTTYSAQGRSSAQRIFVRGYHISVKGVNNQDTYIAKRSEIQFIGSELFAFQQSLLNPLNPALSKDMVTLKVKLFVRADRVRVENINAPAPAVANRVLFNNCLMQALMAQQAAATAATAAAATTIQCAQHFITKESRRNAMVLQTKKSSTKTTAVAKMLHAVEQSRQWEWDAKHRLAAPQPTGLNVNMRNYQLESLQFMLECETAELGVHEATYSKIMTINNQTIYYSTTLGTFAHQINGSIKGGMLGEVSASNCCSTCCCCCCGGASELLSLPTPFVYFCYRKWV